LPNFDATEKMLSYFIRKTNQQVDGWTRPRVVFSVPSQITPVERCAVKESGYRRQGQRGLPSGRADGAALAPGLPITEAAGSMIIDVGCGTTDIAVISLSGVVISKSVRSSWSATIPQTALFLLVG
jgi:rod shape-determining protein MreB